MDVMMPVMDGLAATRAIRASSATDAQTIPVIAMTANAFEEDIRKTHDAGMNAHLSKPIRIKEVLKVLASFVSVPKMQDPKAEGENADTNENEDVSESPDVSESSNLSETTDVSENSDVSESSDLCGNTESENPGNESPA